jgi:hypothetical protein
VAGEAQAIDIIRAQQVRISASMGLMANRASLPIRWLVQNTLDLVSACLALVAALASCHRTRLYESGVFAGVRVVTGGTVALGSGVLNLCSIDLLTLLVVARKAQPLRIGLRQFDFSGGSGFMASRTGRLVLERLVFMRLHQLRRFRLVRIMALCAIRIRKRLTIVRFRQLVVFRVVTVSAQGGDRLGQVKVEFGFADLATLMRHVTAVTTHVQGRVAAAVGWCRKALIVTAQA